MARIRSIGLWSAFKLFGVLYAFAGLLIGGIISLFSMLGFMGGLASGMDQSFAFLFGTAAIVIAPIFYGIVGAMAGAFGCLIYNLAASLSGGLEVRLE